MTEQREERKEGTVEEGRMGQWTTEGGGGGRRNIYHREASHKQMSNSVTLCTYSRAPLGARGGGSVLYSYLKTRILKGSEYSAVVQYT